MTVVAGTKLESGRAITPSKMAKTKIKKQHAHLHIIRRQSTKFQIKKCRRSCGDKISDGRKDESHFYSPPSPTSGDDNKLGKGPLGIATYLISSIRGSDEEDF